ncbi:MAG: CDP-alcohol phosphatidyltransferase family protein [Chlamydiia bacterium]|nr:CDP-alcohol phosphatidyltransferase family protein [Chlamydiia bacterium]
MNLPNLISLLRIPLALVLFVPNTPLRMVVLFIALITDGLDGYLARTFKQKTRMGAIIDPITDKFFVGVALMVCLFERPLHPWQITAFFSRDIALGLITLRALIQGSIHRHPVKSIWPGKLSTALQFVALALLIQGILIPSFVWGAFVVLGILFLQANLKVKPAT